MWLTNTLEELNMQVTNAAVICTNNPAIDVIYNHQIGDQSKYIEVAYHLVHLNVESG
jgi:hypothetical protein